MIFLNYVLLVFGAFNIAISFMQNTKNALSAIIYKVIPFIGGVACIITALEYLNIINIIV